MRISKRQHSPPGQGIIFFGGFLRRPQQVGSVIPSSRFLIRRIIDIAEVAAAQCIVELGPGTGSTTRALLSAMQADARLLAIEINPDFISLLRQIEDPRLIIHHGDAYDLTEIIAAHQLVAPDVVISGIPFSTIPTHLGLAIINSIAQILTAGGRFVAYQFRDRVETLGRMVFGPAQVKIELRNIPPLRIYCWTKPAAKGKPTDH